MIFTKKKERKFIIFSVILTPDTYSLRLIKIEQKKTNIIIIMKYFTGTRRRMEIIKSWWRKKSYTAQILINQKLELLTLWD